MAVYFYPSFHEFSSTSFFIGHKRGGELSILKKLNCHLQVARNPAYHGEASTSEERSTSSKEIVSIRDTMYSAERLLSLFISTLIFARSLFWSGSRLYVCVNDGDSPLIFVTIYENDLLSPLSNCSIRTCTRL